MKPLRFAGALVAATIVSGGLVHATELRLSAAPPKAHPGGKLPWRL